MEYLCHLCHDWQNSKHCQFHFEWQHGQSGVTLEKLQERLKAIGGLDMRESEPDASLHKWELDDPLVTNNFRHRCL
jgi:hypothetical protein